MSEQTLREIFVARQPLVDRLVRDIRDATTSGARRHALLVGPRGIGKTHLVSMVYYAIKADADLYAKLRIAWLREEEWSVFSYADLLVRIFRALANEYPEERAELNAFASRLMRLPIEEGNHVGETKLLEWLGDRLLLLIAENFNDLLEGMGEPGQQSLRAFLQNHSQAVLVTTSPSLTPDLSGYDAPFYGYFNVTHLKELTREEARQLLIRIATTVEHDDELAAYLQTDEADRRLRVIETLAGGHPRIWILFSGCMSRRLLDELVPLFVKMLDDLTPYYQDRMRALPPQERRIIAYLCEQSGAVPVKEIAEDCRLKPNATAALLGNLEAKGYVRKAPEPIAASVGDRRIAYYQLREPLMRLCIEIKENRADPLRLIVEFLRFWFREDDIKQRLHSLPSHAAMTRLYMEATLQRMREVRQEYSGFIVQGNRHMAEGKAREALESYENAITLQPDEVLAWKGRSIVLGQLGRWEEALHSDNRAIALQPDDVTAWGYRAADLWQLERWAEVLESFDHVLALQPDNASAWRYRGVALGQLERPAEALDSLDHAVSLQPDDASAWNNRGVALGQLGRWAEALDSYDRAVAIQSEDGLLHTNRAECLAALHRLDEACVELEIALDLPHQEENGLQSTTAVVLREMLLTPSHRDRWSRWAERMTSAFVMRQSVPLLATAVSRAIPTLFSETVTDGLAQEWLAAWEAAGRDRPQMDVALRLLRAAVEWKRTRDRGAILRLAAEERTVLEELLPHNPPSPGSVG